MHAMLEVTEGLLSVGVPSNGHMDAAIQDDIGALEIELGTPANVFVGPRTDYKGPLTLTVAIHPGRMRELGLLLLDKSGAPAFGEGMWRAIRDSIDRDLISLAANPMRAPREQIDALVAASNRIKDAYP